MATKATNCGDKGKYIAIIVLRTNIVYVTTPPNNYLGRWETLDEAKCEAGCYALKSNLLGQPHQIFIINTDKGEVAAMVGKMVPATLPWESKE